MIIIMVLGMALEVFRVFMKALNLFQKPSNVSLKPGMIISNEPGFYKNNSFGIRIENLVL